MYLNQGAHNGSCPVPYGFVDPRLCVEHSLRPRPQPWSCGDGTFGGPTGRCQCDTVGNYVWEAVDCGGGGGGGGGSQGRSQTWDDFAALALQTIEPMYGGPLSPSVLACVRAQIDMALGRYHITDPAEAIRLWRTLPIADIRANLFANCPPPSAGPPPMVGEPGGGGWPSSIAGIPMTWLLLGGAGIVLILFMKK